MLRAMASFLRAVTEAVQDDAGLVSPEDGGKEGNLSKNETEHCLCSNLVVTSLACDGRRPNSICLSSL